MRQLSIIGKFVDSKVNRFVFRLIGKIAFNQFRDHLDHTREIAGFGCPRVFIRGFDPQSLEVFKKSPFEWFGEIGQ